MNELMLIDMMSGLNPELLQDDYIEKDMKREKRSFLGWLFSFQKTSQQEYEIPLYNTLSEENKEAYVPNCEEREETDKVPNTEFTETGNVDVANEISRLIESVKETVNPQEYNLNDRGFSISIFKRNFRNLIKIISGIVAAFIVVIGIILIIVRHHKGGIKFYEKKVQVIY